jgi:RTX calcium-binding nonapeptide repeat (4 copies)
MQREPAFATRIKDTAETKNNLIITKENVAFATAGITIATLLLLLLSSLVVTAITPPISVLAATFSGTPGNDVIVGTQDDDTITLEEGGNDIAIGLGGEDVITKLGHRHTIMLGGEDNDQLRFTLTSKQEERATALINGQQGNDKIVFGTDGSLSAGSGYADIYGGNGRDTIEVVLEETRGDASVSGGSGSDNISVTDIFGKRPIHGDSGNDIIKVRGDTGYGAVYGDGGNDRLLDQSELGANLYGGRGNDYMESEAGDETEMTGGSDADTFVCKEDRYEIIHDYRPDQDRDRLVTAEFCDEVNNEITTTVVEEEEDQNQQRAQQQQQQKGIQEEQNNDDNNNDDQEEEIREGNSSNSTAS